jgi:hypothetical protein
VLILVGQGLIFFVTLLLAIPSSRLPSRRRAAPASGSTGDLDSGDPNPDALAGAEFDRADFDGADSDD